RTGDSRVETGDLLTRPGSRQLSSAPVAELGRPSHVVALDLASEGDLEFTAAVWHRPVDGEVRGVCRSSERELTVLARQPAGQPRTLLLDVHRKFLRPLRRGERDLPFAAHVGLRE